MLKPVTDNDDDPNSTKYQDHIVCCYGYKLIWIDEQYSWPHKAYFGEYAINNFVKAVIN